jgi:hypothetical protein
VTFLPLVLFASGNWPHALIQSNMARTVGKSKPRPQADEEDEEEEGGFESFQGARGEHDTASIPSADSDHILNLHPCRRKEGASKVVLLVVLQTHTSWACSSRS